MLIEEQHALRKHGITGSELAGICGVSPWGAPIDVYAAKLGYRPDLDWTDNDGLVRGTLFEEPVLRWYEIKTKRQVVRPRDWAQTDTDTLVHPEYPIVIATPDGISRGDGQDIVAEVKCPSWRMGHYWGDEGTDQIPEYYLPQVMWEMAVTGLRTAHVTAYLGDAPRIYKVDWDQDLFDALLETAERFWRDHVLSRVPPPVDGSQAYSDWIARTYPQRLSSYKKMDATIEPYVTQLMDLRAVAKTIAEQERACRNHIELFIGEHAGLDCGELGRIDWRQNKATAKVDWKTLAIQEFGANDDIAAAYTQVKDGNRPFTPRLKRGA